MNNSGKFKDISLKLDKIWSDKKYEFYLTNLFIAKFTQNFKNVKI